MPSRAVRRKLAREAASRAARELRAGLPAWTPFERGVAYSHILGRVVEGSEVYTNSRYQVEVLRDVVTGFGDPARGGAQMKVTWLSIKNRDLSARHDWRDLQRIKNELTDPECEAIEVYPAESRRVDTSDQFHLWVAPKGFKWPLGFAEREVAEGGPPGGSQRPFEADDRPGDLRPSMQFYAAARAAADEAQATGAFATHRRLARLGLHQPEQEAE